MAFNRNRALEAAKDKLQRQKNTIALTQEEIKYLQEHAPTATKSLNEIFRKLDRQTKAAEITQELVEAYEQQLTKENEALKDTISKKKLVDAYEQQLTKENELTKDTISKNKGVI